MKKNCTIVVWSDAVSFDNKIIRGTKLQPDTPFDSSYHQHKDTHTCCCIQNHGVYCIVCFAVCSVGKQQLLQQKRLSRQTLQCQPANKSADTFQTPTQLKHSVASLRLLLCDTHTINGDDTLHVIFHVGSDILLCFEWASLEEKNESKMREKKAIARKLIQKLQ